MTRLLHMENWNNKTGKRFWNIAWPASLEGLLIVLLSSVDLMMISSLGVEATSAVGVFSQPKMILLCVARSFAIAVTTRIARLQGEGRDSELSSCLKQALILILIVAGIMTITAFNFLSPILRLAGAQDDYFILALDYSRPVIISIFFTSVSIILHAGLLGIGHTKVMMASNVIGNLINVGLNALLIYGLGPFPVLGVRGAAYGTLFGSLATLIITLLVVSRKDISVSLFGLKGWLPESKNISVFSRIFAGTLTEQSAERVGMFIYSRMIAGLGILPFAVHTICMNLCDLYYNFAHGMGKASMVLSGHNMGSNDREEFHRSASVGQRIGFMMSFIAFTLYILLRTHLIGLYHSDEQVIELGRQIMLLVAIVSFPESQSLICSGTLRGAGYISYVAKYSIISIAIIRPIITWVLCYRLGLGLYGAWIALFIDQSTRAICATLGVGKLLKRPYQVDSVDSINK